MSWWNVPPTAPSNWTSWDYPKLDEMKSVEEIQYSIQQLKICKWLKGANNLWLVTFSMLHWALRHLYNPFLVCRSANCWRWPSWEPQQLWFVSRQKIEKHQTVRHTYCFGGFPFQPAENKKKKKSSWHEPSAGACLDLHLWAGLVSIHLSSNRKNNVLWNFLPPAGQKYIAAAL